MVNAQLATCDGAAESVTRTVNVLLPATLGVPLITPAALRLSPGGN
jgi:hypothetical protein